jgi:hypothetical protein
MIAPDGSTGDIPQERAAEAQAAGFKPAVVMTSPDGKMGYIPRERANEALKAGFKVGQPTTSVEQQGPSAYGFTPGNLVKNVGRGLSELGKGAVQIADDVGGAILPQRFGGDPITQTKLVQHVVDPMQAEAAKARQGGPGSVGHAIASGIPMIGPYAANLGEQAGSGDIGGALARGGTQMAAPSLVKKIPMPAKVGDFLQRQASDLYQSALKPSTSLRAPNPAGLVKTGLQNEIPVSAAGLEKLSTLIDDVNNKIADTVKSDPLRTVSRDKVALRLNDTVNKFKTQVNPTADLQAIADSGNEFMKTQPSQIPVGDAQALKQGTYQQIKSKNYGELKSAAEESQKALARGLKEELNNVFPELKNLNAQDSQLLNLQPALEKAIARIGNHQMIGIGTPIATGAVKAVTGSNGVAAVAGAMKAIVDTSSVKSQLAMALYRAGRAKGVTLPVARARVQGFVTSLAAAASANSEAGDGQSTQ